jgi:hypothetical protein
VTKAELEEFAAELESVILEAYEALQNGDPDQATKLLSEYVDPNGGTETDAPGGG